MNVPLYFVAILPPQPISETITNWKHEIAQKYGASHALKSPPHITLQRPFRRLINEENSIIQGLQRFSNKHTPFPVHLSGINCFRPRVIYIDVAEPELMNHRYKLLQTFLMEDLNFKKRELNQNFVPHITLATRDLSKRMFSMAWAEIKDRNYSAEFCCRELTLLSHNGVHWEVLKKFHWGG